MRQDDMDGDKRREKVTSEGRRSSLYASLERVAYYLPGATTIHTLSVSLSRMISLLAFSLLPCFLAWGLAPKVYPPRGVESQATRRGRRMMAQVGSQVAGTVLACSVVSTHAQMPIYLPTYLPGNGEWGTGQKRKRASLAA
ncbi:hypothetical protein IF2G_00266 [Cordyceps javanica]|nr:hypothetical protein IF2G_00266 [Cordyceps javanica]